MYNEVKDSQQSDLRLLSLLGEIFSIAGFILLCLAFVMLVGGGLLADYYDAQHINWRLPDPYWTYPLLIGFACAFLGFILHAHTSFAASLRARIEIILTIIIIFPLLFIILSRARPVDLSVNCLLNQRHLTIACHTYAEDHNGRLPQLWSDIDSYLDDEMDIRVCPISRRPFHHQLGYGMNDYITGKLIANITAPNSILLTADSMRPFMMISSPADIDFNRHAARKGIAVGGEIDMVDDPSRPRGAFVSFLDGHVVFIDARTKTIRFK